MCQRIGEMNFVIRWRYQQCLWSGNWGGMTLFPQVLICLLQNGINQFPCYIIPGKHLFSFMYTPVLSDEQKYKVIIELQQPHSGNKPNYVFGCETNQREKTRRKKNIIIKRICLRKQLISEANLFTVFLCFSLVFPATSFYSGCRTGMLMPCQHCLV